MNTIKKTILVLAALAACGSLPFRTNAQTSSRHLYNSLTGDEVRLTSNGLGGASIISYNSHTNYSPYCFVYHRQGTNTTFCYQSSNGTPPTNTPDWYDVKDIDVIGDYCYFCGTYYVTTLEYDTSGLLMFVTTGTGYIGRFLVYDISNGTSPMPIQFCVIPNTKTLDKLVGFTVAVNNYIYLIGEHSSGLSCLATIKENWSNISCGLHVITDATETLTDLALTDRYVVTVSRFDSDSYSFGLRAEKISNTMSALANSSVLPMFPYQNKYNTTTVNTQPEVRPQNPTFHSNEVEMKIAAANWDDNAVVAYDCIGGALDNDCFTDLYHTSMFYVDFNSYNPAQNALIYLFDAQLVSKSQQVDNSLRGLACHQYSTILFHNYPANTGDNSGEIQFPSWLSTGQVDNLLVDYRDLQDMSLDLYYNRVNFAGFQQTDNKIVHFWQYYPDTKNSCYSTRPKASSELMTLPNMTLTQTGIDTEYSTIEWGHQLNRPPVQTDCILDCRTN